MLKFEPRKLIQRREMNQKGLGRVKEDSYYISHFPTLMKGETTGSRSPDNPKQDNSQNKIKQITAIKTTSYTWTHHCQTTKTKDENVEDSLWWNG